MDVAGIPRKQRRDGRLDFWRGVCLVDMLIVHLVYAGIQFGKVLTPVFGEYTRFAAGGFIFCSGLCIGSIFLPRVREASRRWPTYWRLWRRSLVILLVQYAAATALVLLAVARGYRQTNELNLGLIWRVLTLREGSDLLPLYVIFVAFSPLLLEMVRRGYSLLVLAASAVVFAWGQHHPWTFSEDLGFFPPALWQAVFVPGLLFGSKLRQFDALKWAWKLRVLCGAFAVFVLMCACDYGPILGLRLLQWSGVSMAFSKVPLSLGELLRYLSLTISMLVGTSMAWPWVERARLAQFLANLGRRSLLVYVAHLFVLEALVVLSWHMEWLGAAQATFTILGLAALRIVVWLADKTPALVDAVLALARTAMASPSPAEPAWPGADVAMEGQR